MSSIKDRLNEPTSPRTGVGSELRHIRENGQASAQEIRDFLKSVEGKSPQEVMGVVAQSGLAASILLATVGCGVLLVVFSVIPYQLNKLSAADEESPKAKSSAPETTEPAEPESSPAPADQQASAKPQPQNGSETDPNAPDPTLPDKLGIGETKAADPKANPLDSNIDNLLDGID